MTDVRFVKGMPPYNAGEIAGFDTVRADKLVAQGYAVRLDAAQPAKAAPVAAVVPPSAPAQPGAAPAGPVAAVMPPSGPPAVRRGA